MVLAMTMKYKGNANDEDDNADDIDNENGVD